MSQISQTLLQAVLRLADAPQRTLSKVASRFTAVPPVPVSSPTPDHIALRLEGMFEALSELTLQPHVPAALELACDAMQAELPTEVVAAGIYDIDCDQIRIVAARGAEHDLLRGSVMPRERCLVGAALSEPVITRSDALGADWLCDENKEAPVLLCPIQHDAHLLGLLALASPLCSADFDRHDIELASYVADQLSSFIKARRQQRSIPAPAQLATAR